MVIASPPKAACLAETGIFRNGYTFVPVCANETIPERNSEKIRTFFKSVIN